MPKANTASASVSPRAGRRSARVHPVGGRHLDIYNEGAGWRANSASKEDQTTARDERRMNREAARIAAELKTVADAEAEQALVETGLTECPEASKYWENLEEKSASYDDYQQQYELSKKKIMKMKVTIEGLITQLDLYAAEFQKLEEERNGLGDRLEELENSLKSERDENRRYGEALADARRQIEVLTLEGIEGLGGYSQATDIAYLD